jgi:putative lipoprotein (rSAM/lipoprotein system)
MKVRFNRWYNAVLTALMSMLGYGCSSSEDSADALMYGVPVAGYQIKGQVTDEAGTPVQGIKTAVKIIMSSPSADGKKEIYARDSVLTDASGKYDISFVTTPGNPETKLIVEDIDGVANGGEFLSDTLDIDYEKAVHMDDSYRYELNMNVKLKKK